MVITRKKTVDHAEPPEKYPALAVAGNAQKENAAAQNAAYPAPAVDNPAQLVLIPGAIVSTAVPAQQLTDKQEESRCRQQLSMRQQKLVPAERGYSDTNRRISGAGSRRSGIKRSGKERKGAIKHADAD